MRATIARRLQGDDVNSAAALALACEHTAWVPGTAYVAVWDQANANDSCGAGAAVGSRSAGLSPLVAGVWLGNQRSGASASASASGLASEVLCLEAPTTWFAAPPVLVPGFAAAGLHAKQEECESESGDDLGAMGGLFGGHCTRVVLDVAAFVSGAVSGQAVDGSWSLDTLVRCLVMSLTRSRGDGVVRLARDNVSHAVADGMAWVTFIVWRMLRSRCQVAVSKWDLAADKAIAWLCAVHAEQAWRTHDALTGCSGWCIGSGVSRRRR